MSKISKHYKRASKELKIIESSINKSLISTKISSTAVSSVAVSTKNVDLGSLETISSMDYTSMENCSFAPSSPSDSSHISENLLSLHDCVDKDHELDYTDGGFLKCQLSEWVVKHNITHTAANDLLKLLKPHHPNLPTDVRTLLRTPKKHVLRNIEPCAYYHFGVKQSIEKLLLKFILSSSTNSDWFASSNNIEVFVNIDGLPLSKSSSSQFYPILCKLSISNDVNLIGIYHGNEKPQNANCFLNDFVEEITDLINNVLIYKKTKCFINIKGFICDAPDKSFINYVKGHSGYMSCTKCFTEGSYFNDRICFPQTSNLRLRTDSDFRQKIQQDHHIETSIIENIPGVNMVKSFPLDYMHLVCLGVVKKLINLWLCGKPSKKLPFKNVSDVSDLLTKLAGKMTFEFNRKPRAITVFKRWEATEFRQFLLYTGPLSFIPLFQKIDTLIFCLYMLL